MNTMEHPIWDSLWRKMSTIGGVLIIAMLQSYLLWAYAEATLQAAMIDGFLSIFLLALLLYLAWYIVRFVDVLQVNLVTGFLLLSFWCLGGVVIQDINRLITETSYLPFLETLLFRLAFAVPTWCAVMLWYRLEILQHSANLQEENAEKEETENPEQYNVATEEWIDRITVKDGSRIHLINVSDLHYIQACGDYVTLVTPEGQYIKEQTMKYFEAHLPQTIFVRIHRSTIVNVTQISRIELFGKENYNLFLKTGEKLRVSLSGYRLLRERLEL